MSQAMTVEQAISAALDLHQRGDLVSAETAYRQILQQVPQIPEIHNNLGCIHFDQGKFAEAVENYLAALRLNPAYNEALNNLGNAYKKLGRLSEAVDCYHKAINLRPGHAAFYNNLGATLRELGQFERAAEYLRLALSFRPDYADAHLNLGIVLGKQDRSDEAISSFTEALRRNPNNPNVYLGLGNFFYDEGKVSEAIDAYETALSLQPNWEEAKWNLALALLLQGDLARGWEGNELRFKFQDAYPHGYAKPFWKGGEFRGKRLLIYDEIGYGDVFQFVRYMPWVKERGGTVLFECKKGLGRLLRNLAGVDELLERGAMPVPLERFDLQLPMESLPFIFQTTLDSIPDNVPYLAADPDLTAVWKERLKNLEGLRVGLVWAGNPDNQYDSSRSCGLADFAPLASVPGVSFVSLQKGAAEVQAAKPPAGMSISRLGEELADFADTAAVIENLDLVISVETAVPHLAGAMGKPVWTLLSFVPAWRWMLERNDSPWYPTMRLFRQPRKGDWASVMMAVAGALGEFRSV